MVAVGGNASGCTARLACSLTRRARRRRLLPPLWLTLRLTVLGVVILAGLGLAVLIVYDLVR